MINLKGAKVVLDKKIPKYITKVQRGNWFPNTPHPSLAEGDVYIVPERRIIAFQDPNLVLIISNEELRRDTGKLFTLSDYKQKHKDFLQEIGNYGFIRKENEERWPSVLQKLVDKEEEIFEEVISSYQTSLKHSTK